MPPIGMLMGGLNFSDYFIDLTALWSRVKETPVEVPKSYEAAKQSGHAIIAYGRFINALINLLIVGAVIFFLATAYILGREYFELAAMRFRSPAEAKALRKQNATMVFIGGLLIAAFVSIPIVNLATPLFAMAFMVHLHKRASAKTLIAHA